MMMMMKMESLCISHQGSSSGHILRTMTERTFRSRSAWRTSALPERGVCVCVCVCVCYSYSERTGHRLGLYPTRPCDHDCTIMIYVHMCLKPPAAATKHHYTLQLTIISPSPSKFRAIKLSFMCNCIHYDTRALSYNIS